MTSNNVTFYVIPDYIAPVENMNLIISTISLNLTWDNFLSKIDASGNSFVHYQEVVSIEPGKNVTIKLTNLTAETSYYIYYGAKNQLMPPIMTNIYVAKATTNPTNEGNGSGKIMIGIVTFIICVCFIILSFKNGLNSEVCVFLRLDF